MPSDPPWNGNAIIFTNCVSWVTASKDKTFNDDSQGCEQLNCFIDSCALSSSLPKESSSFSGSILWLGIWTKRWLGSENSIFMELNPVMDRWCSTLYQNDDILIGNGSIRDVKEGYHHLPSHKAESILERISIEQGESSRLKQTTKYSRYLDWTNHWRKCAFATSILSSCSSIPYLKGGRGWVGLFWGVGISPRSQCDEELFIKRKAPASFLAPPLWDTGCEKEILMRRYFQLFPIVRTHQGAPVPLYPPSTPSIEILELLTREVSNPPNTNLTMLAMRGCVWQNIVSTDDYFHTTIDPAVMLSHPSKQDDQYRMDGWIEGPRAPVSFPIWTCPIIRVFWESKPLGWISNCPWAKLIPSRFDPRALKVTLSLSRSFSLTSSLTNRQI